MKLSITTTSLSADTDLRSWITEKKSEEQTWSKKSNSYRKVIAALLFLGGDFVHIPKSGDALINLLSKSGRKLRFPYRKLPDTGANTKMMLLKHTKDDPERYRVCVGYCLLIEKRVSFWTQHYWLFDKQLKSILEATPLKPRFYYGIILSQKGSTQLLEKAKDYA